MSFAVLTHQTNGFQEIILVEKNTNTEVVILPEYGALLHAFIVQTRNGSFNVIDNYEDNESLQKQLGISFKSSKLSPFPCRISDGRYNYNGQTFEFRKKFNDGSAIHGLLYNKLFKMVDEFSDKNHAWVRLKYNYTKEDPGYPFEYRCEVRYILLTDQILQVETTVINLDKIPIPIADGWHPYFKLGGKIDDWLLCFTAETMVEFDEKLVPTGRLVPYSMFNEERPINDTKLDNCFVLTREKGMASCTLFNPSNHLSVGFFPDESYPYLQIYTPPHRESIAIENLSAAPNCFNNKMGLTILEPRDSKTFTLHYKVNIK